MPMATMLQGNYVLGMHAYNDRTCKAYQHVHELVYAGQLVGCRQIHNYIYIYIYSVKCEGSLSDELSVAMWCTVDADFCENAVLGV